MAVDFRAVGALAANATTTTLAIVAPTLSVDDVMIASINQKANQLITPPAGWEVVVEVNNTTAQRTSIFWKRAEAGDSGATFNFTKPSDDNILFCGCISAWSGCITTATPIDATAPSTSANAAADEITYADFDPTETIAFVVAIGTYNEDQTTAGGIGGTNPTFTNRWDLETPTGADSSIFGDSGSSNGAATGARSQTSTSMTDAINTGILFGLVAAPVAEGTPQFNIAYSVP